MTTALVYGIAIAGEAAARALFARGYRVLAADDAPTETRRRIAAAVGAELIERPDEEAIVGLVGAVDLVVPAPGVPESHPVVRSALAAGTPLRTELDLAYEWEQDRPGGPRPMVAVTGTDGKTTTTMMVASILSAGGHVPAVSGNTDLPLVQAIDDQGTDVFAVECSSFRLAWPGAFRAEAAIWLNLAPDHLNWHTDMASYVAAKANVWARQRPSDVAIGFGDDPVVMRHLATAPGRTRTFALASGDYRVEAGALVGPQGPFAATSDLVRAFPHDLTNALAASAACLESGLVGPADVAEGLRAFRFPPHRIEPLGARCGVDWYNDSKATTPHAALSAIRSFESLVLIAGGRNKGLDLTTLAAEAHRMRAVVAIGEAAAEIEAAFHGLCPVSRATSMREAVEAASRLARQGDTVLLSPACASFDWYPEGGYPARGEEFRSMVGELIGVHR